MDKQKAADIQAQIYTFLKSSYDLELNLPFAPGPDPQHELTAKDFGKGMFELVQKGVQALDEQARYKALVAMRQIVGLIETREQTFVKEYIYGQLIDYCFREIKQNRSQKLRYEALLILENLANDSHLCSHLITSKNCIQVLLDFLGNEDHTLIRNKAKYILREIISQNTQAMEKIRSDCTSVVNVIEKLKNVTKRIQAREIIWIIQKIYNREMASQKPEIAHQVCSIFCEAIKSKLFEDDKRQEGSDLTVVFYGLSSLYLQYNEVVVCISQYEILGQLMDYARLQENLSLPAMIILEGLVEELIQNNMFLDLAQFLLTKKQEKTWLTLSVLLKILSKMALEIDELQFLDFALSKPQLLKSLTSLLWSNKQPQKNKEIEQKKQKAIPQIAASICNLYLSMMAADIEKDSSQNKMILDFIWSQDILSVALILLSAQMTQNKHFELGLETIEIIATFAVDQKKSKLDINQKLIELKILPLLQKLQKSENSKLSGPAKRILENFFRNLNEEDNKKKKVDRGKKL